jgi:hypothetical protein
MNSGPDQLFFYNTDRRALNKSRATVLLKKGLAVTGGKHGPYLGKPKPGNWLVMYENERGILAVGEVLEYWDGKARPKHIYYDSNSKGKEFHLRVDWFEKFPNNPINLKTLQSFTGNNFNPRGATQKINKLRTAVLACIEQHLSKPLPKFDSKASSATTPSRTRVTIERIVRDTKRSKRVKELNGDRCQLCTVELKFPNGRLYAEAHHVKPLGGIHKGSGGEMEITRDWGAKLAGATLRIAAVLHCVERSPIDLIDRQTIRAATDIARFLIPHAEAVLDMMLSSKKAPVCNAAYVLKWIKRHRKTEFSKTEAQHHGKRRFPKADDIDSALNELIHRRN